MPTKLEAQMPTVLPAIVESLNAVGPSLPLEARTQVERQGEADSSWLRAELARARGLGVRPIDGKRPANLPTSTHPDGPGDGIGLGVIG